MLNGLEQDFWDLVFRHVVFLLQDNDLSEFDESREIVQNLVDEYKACESADYIKWGMEVRDVLPLSSACRIASSNHELTISVILCVQDRGKQVSGEGNTSGTMDSRVAPP